MRQCWKQIPEERPDFQLITNRILFVLDLPELSSKLVKDQSSLSLSLHSDQSESVTPPLTKVRTLGEELGLITYYYFIYLNRREVIDHTTRKR